MAVIYICDLKVRTIIGAHAWERKNKQDILINVMLEYDASKAAKSDKLKDALDYDTVSAKVIKTTESSKFLLLERLAAKLLEDIMTDKRVLAAAVRLDKPHAIPEAKCVSFELSAQRD